MGPANKEPIVAPQPTPMPKAKKPSRNSPSDVLTYHKSPAPPNPKGYVPKSVVRPSPMNTLKTDLATQKPVVPVPSAETETTPRFTIKTAPVATAVKAPAATTTSTAPAPTTATTATPTTTTVTPATPTITKASTGFVPPPPIAVAQKSAPASSDSLIPHEKV